MIRFGIYCLAYGTTISVRRRSYSQYGYISVCTLRNKSSRRLYLVKHVLVGGNALLESCIGAFKFVNDMRKRLQNGCNVTFISVQIGTLMTI